jgi:hypothetical protein
VLETLRKKDNQSLQSTGVRRFFVVKGYEEMADFFKHWWFPTYVDHSVDSADFATAYTSTPLEDLKHKLAIVLKEAWTFEAEEADVKLGQMKIRWTGKKTCTWTKARQTHHSKTLHTFSCYQVIQLLNFLIDNTYVVNGGVLRRQTKGIPMGTNCAPAIFNLYLYYYESRWIDEMLENDRMDEAKKYHMTFRLIDDVCAVDCPDFKELCSSYPDFLSLDNTTLEDDSVNFLGMNLKFTESGLQMKVYDKRKDYPFKVVRFPNLLSEIPEHQAYGLFIGLLHRFYRICNYPKFFLTASVDVAQTLDSQGCKYMKLFKVFSNFLSSKRKLRWPIIFNLNKDVPIVI